MPGDVWGEWADEGNEEGCDVTEDEAHNAADDAENEGFEEELEQDLARACADGFADADFAGALRDRDEHDVHDANAANDEGDAGHEGEHAGNDGKHRAGWMEIAGAGDDLEVFVAILESFELLADFCDGGFDVARSVSADIDLLNLNRGFEGAGVIDADEDCVIEVDVVEVDRIVHFVEDTDDHELLVVVSESAGDCFRRAKEGHRGFVADDGDVFAKFVIEELAVLEMKVEDVLEVVVGSNDGIVLVNLAGNRNGAIADGDWRGRLDGLDLFDGLHVFDGEVGLAKLAGVSEAIDEAAFSFAEAWANENEVRVVFVAICANEIIHATSKGHDEHDAGDANSDAERGQESAAAVLAQVIEREMEMSV